MSEKTGIAWTDSSWNPWHGCIKISPGCKFCYMYRDKARYGQDPTKVVRSKTTFRDPLKWKSGRVFTCSWSDFFIEQADPWREEAWDVIRQTPHLTYQILTKRPQNIAERLPSDWGEGWPHVWIGASVEDQDYLWRVERLRNVKAAVHFLSLEPLLADLGSVDLAGIEWVIVGGESGPKARSMSLAWAWSLLQQCRTAKVPFFMKQTGARPQSSFPIQITGAGADPDEWPAHLRVQEFPQ